ncbi:MAG: DUF1015 domain-containing protein [Desulfobacterales bacterium]|nr:DUF1015 domain-containing protein [Desulfobacterales bacterium]
MAEILPFQGILYNPEQIDNLSHVVAPPYDVISADEQAAFHRLHPKNIIRLILGEKKATDTPEDNPHTRAANYFRQWLAEGTLAQDDRPALYLTSVDFPLEDRTITRYGIIALVRLEPFEKKVILPHEQTFSKVKSERLELMKRCHANFSPIFSLFSDPSGVVDRLKASASDREPDMDVTDHKGIPHRLWRVTDPQVHHFVEKGLTDRQLFIADGHHRYETALTYRDWIAESDPSFDSRHPANFVMMYLCSMEDPGMLIRPAHRLLSEVPAASLKTLMAKAAEAFDITSYPFTPGNRQEVLEGFTKALKDDADNRTVIGACIHGETQFYHMALRPGIMQARFGHEMAASLLDLDVTVLTRLIFMEILQFDQVRLDDASKIAYASLTHEAMDTVHQGRADIAFILNATRMEQVRRVSSEGLTMPRKSTYFYPKVLSGRVLNKLTRE